MHGEFSQQAFVEELTDAQFDLLAFISMLVGNKSDARDVLQETNRMLWAKAGEYDPERPFLPWARAFARYEVLRYRKTLQRERLVFSDATFETLAGADADPGERFDRRLEWLDQCLEKLTDAQRTVIRAKYYERLTVAQMAGRFGCSAASVVSLLYRIRQALGQCLERHRKREANGWL